MMQQPKKLLLMLGGILSFLVLTRVIIITPMLVSACASWIAYPLILVQDSFVTPWHTRKLEKKSAQELCKAVTHYKQLSSQLLAENIALASMQLHNQQTQELASFGKRYKTEKAVISQVILKHIADEGHFFLVDAGSKKGITLDMIAVYNNCLIGRVSEVYPYYSKITLITDKLSKVPVVCAATRAQGIHEGCNMLKEGRLEFVSHLQEMRPGDLVLSSGDGLIYPKGFAVGTVRDFSLNALGLTYIVAIEPLVDFMEIAHCYLVQKGAEYDGPPAVDTTGGPESITVPKE